MSGGMIFSAGLGVLAPLSLIAACVFEAMAFKMAKNPRCDQKLLAKRRSVADVLLVAAWLLLAAAYLGGKYMVTAAEGAAFTKLMTWILGALLLADIYYLYLRRSRPKRDGSKKKNFWEL